MPGLSSSRHAPHPPPARRNSINTHPPPPPPPVLTITPAPAGDPAPPALPSPSKPASHHQHHHHPRPHPHPSSSKKHDLGRYAKIIRRLQWKLPFLAAGYHQAVHRVGTDPAAVAEAELMFKLDFFEYYMLIERALVHLLGVFGVDIPRGSSPFPIEVGEGEGEMKKKNNNKGLVGSAWKEGGGGGRHRYHANVLAALDREENPLHGVLGMGPVRLQLGRAKDLRNRWKTAGDDEEEEEDGGHDRDGREWHTRRMAAPLETYNLEKMLEVIFEGLEEAFKVAERFVCGDSEAGVEGDIEMFGEDGRVVDWAAAAGDDEDQWEFMVDAMDWEAV